MRIPQLALAPSGLRLTAAALLLGLLPSCISHISITRDDEVTVPVSSSGPIALDIETRNGRVSVHEGDSQGFITVEAEYRARGGNRAEVETRLSLFSLDVELDAYGVQRIRPIVPDGWRSGDAANLRVFVPSAGNTRVLTSNGTIEIHGANGECDLRTTNGRIKTSGITGYVHAETSNGSIRIEEQLGPVFADSSNGSMTLSYVDGCTSPFQLDTSNGSISVEMGPDWEGRVTCDTSNGRIRHYEHGDKVRSARRSLALDLGAVRAGAARADVSKASTSNGSITIGVR